MIAEASAPMPLLRVEGLDAGYGSIQVLRQVTFQAQTGEILAIVGANGAGKTTLLRTLSGLLVPTAGRIWLNGTDIAGKSCAEIVGFGLTQAPEGRRCFSGLTVEENLRLGAFRRRGKSRDSVAAALETVFGHFPRLRERRRQLAGTLSGGEQQMCSIGRALMANPRLLIIDELSLGLAPIIVEEILGILDGIHAAGTTILMVEQDVSVALGFSDRAVVLQSGRVVLEGESTALLQDKQIISSYLGG